MNVGKDTKRVYHGLPVLSVAFQERTGAESTNCTRFAESTNATRFASTKEDHPSRYRLFSLQVPGFFPSAQDEVASSREPLALTRLWEKEGTHIYLSIYIYIYVAANLGALEKLL